MRQINFKKYTLGCKVNQYDSNDLAKRLKASGFASVKHDADFAIINSCAVTKTAIRKGRQMISKAKRENPNAKIVLIGCWPRVYELKSDSVADLIIKDKDINKIVKQIKNYNFLFLNMPNLSDSQLQASDPERVRYFLKIQDGCEQFCSYCIIPYARGKMMSRPIREIFGEVEQVAKRGIKEIVLCGIHLGLYGHDSLNQKNKKTLKQNNLVELLKNLLKIKKMARIRLSSIEITEVSDDLIKLMKKEKRLCKHLHIPLQSGTDKILKLMNRPYTKLKFKNKIEKIRRLIPNIAITTDVIIGFPGETEKDFRETCNFIKKIGFSQLHVFPFSAHEKTPAYKLPNQVDEKIIAGRLKKLIAMGKKLEKEFRKKFLGRKLTFLIDNKNRGISEYNFEVIFKNKKFKPGDLVTTDIYCIK
jgi:threonylcarbamoyladenosine tRNA methylthiotransferase MtaB